MNSFFLTYSFPATTYVVFCIVLSLKLQLNYLNTLFIRYHQSYMCCNTGFYLNKLFCLFVMSPAAVGSYVSHYFRAGFLLFSCTMVSRPLQEKCFSLFSNLIFKFRPVSKPKKVIKKSYFEVYREKSKHCHSIGNLNKPTLYLYV